MHVRALAYTCVCAHTGVCVVKRTRVHDLAFSSSCTFEYLHVRVGDFTLSPFLTSDCELHS